MVYSDILKMGLIQPYKKNYGLDDFKKLVETGMSQLTARFILLCTVVYYNIDCKQECYLQDDMCGSGFLKKCELGKAL